MWARKATLHTIQPQSVEIESREGKNELRFYVLLRFNLLWFLTFTVHKAYLRPDNSAAGKKNITEKKPIKIEEKNPQLKSFLKSFQK